MSVPCNGGKSNNHNNQVRHTSLSLHHHLHLFSSFLVFSSQHRALIWVVFTCFDVIVQNDKTWFSYYFFFKKTQSRRWCFGRRRKKINKARSVRLQRALVLARGPSFFAPKPFLFKGAVPGLRGGTSPRHKSRRAFKIMFSQITIICE